MLIFIEGGPEPFANKAFESEVLLEHPQFNTDEYRWTSRVIQSKLYPEKSAQVWRHISVPDDQPAPGNSPIPTATENPNSTASDATTREVVETTPVVSSPVPMPRRVESATSGSPAPETASSLNGLAAAQLVREAQASVALDGETHVVSEDYSGAPVAIDAEDEGDLPDGEQLFLRRKRLKMTVQEVADAVGLKRSRVDAIEKGTAVRGNVAGDLRTVHEFLTARESPPRP